jgi:hypothetical protein
MRNLFYFSLILLNTCTGCVRESDTCHKSIRAINNSPDDIYVDASMYPDTMSYKHYGGLVSQSHIFKIQSGASNIDALSLRSCYETRFTGKHAVSDTLMIFIFDACTLEHNSWDTVVKHNMVQQRYDLSLENLQKLEWSVSFPPTEAMKHIKMYPPYGTYK